MRSFTIVKIVTTKDNKRVNYKGGRFISDVPSSAARKAFSKAYQYKNGKVSSMKVTLQETTRGSQHKEYTYKVTRKSETTTVNRGGEEITYHYSTKVKAL